MRRTTTLGRKALAVTFGLILTGIFPAGAPAASADARLSQWTSDPNAEKISTRLLRLEAASHGNARAAQALGGAAFAGAAEIEIELVTTSLSPAVQKKIAATGARIVSTFPEYNRAVVAIKDLATIHALSAIREVDLLRQPSPRKTRGQVVTSNGIGLVDGRAPRALRADVVRSTYGFDGTGQKIGILSDSFANTTGVRNISTRPAPGVSGILTGSNPQNTGDLPATVQILADPNPNNPNQAGEDEGAAMAELVHDIAPGAAIAFYTAWRSEPDFARGIVRLAQAGCTAIVDDVGYFDEPCYQPGIVQQAAEAAVRAGASYFSACGNNANLALSEPFQITEPSSDGAALHQWVSTGNGLLPVSLPPGSACYFVLQWNQPWQSLNKQRGSQVDLDLYLTDVDSSAGLAAPIAVSDDVQGRPGRPHGDAIEMTAVENDGTETATIYLAINMYKGSGTSIPQNSATPLEFTLQFIPVGGPDPIIPAIPNEQSVYGGPTISGHPLGAGVASVAAIPWWEFPAYNPAFGETLFTDPEWFSSRGGATTQFFDAVGRFSRRTALQPGLSCIDGCDTTFFYSTDERWYGPNGPYPFIWGYEGEPDGWKNFFGTSAAAPNAAAVAALLKQADPKLTPAEIISLLQSTSIDVTGQRAATGWDDVTGFGLIDAKAAVDAAVAPSEF